ncbi:hypothetical protein TRFO_21137 [Tritrichomonas foetus]|uniref:Protein kinase domain-containing protein n=1 Tax=Tritrichomonas foetus TaxID=1144522 RepID=A0A1J4KED3_9EUKA|nr:hypothetical protein TRFO_21137 [Tritrichomonas foetus]|eukprot:OHT09791.1 hypothetical protein TRFO_21137 [Tritrichomonas foetus]
MCAYHIRNGNSSINKGHYDEEYLSNSSNGMKHPKADKIAFQQSKIDQIRKTLESHGYAYVRQLNHGGYSSVHIIHSSRYQCEFAVKVSNRFKDGVEVIDQEVSNLIKMDHPNIIQMYEYFFDPDFLYVILEYCPGGSLADYIKTNGKLKDEVLFQVCFQILQALKYCHSQGIAHRDLKPANVLIDKNNRCKLADFGISKAFRTLNFEQNDENPLTPNLTSNLTNNDLINNDLNYSDLNNDDVICNDLSNNNGQVELSSEQCNNNIEPGSIGNSISKTGLPRYSPSLGCYGEISSFQNLPPYQENPIPAKINNSTSNLPSYNNNKTHLLNMKSRVRIPSLPPSHGASLNRANISLSNGGDVSDENVIQLFAKFGGTRPYMAPELILRKKHDPYKSDVWALAVTFYELLAGNLPWNKEDTRVMEKSITMGYIFFNGIQIRYDFIQLMKRMFSIKPESRPTVDEILMSPVFTELEQNQFSPYSAINFSNNNGNIGLDEKSYARGRNLSKSISGSNLNLLSFSTGTKCQSKSMYTISEEANKENASLVGSSGQFSSGDEFGHNQTSGNIPECVSYQSNINIAANSPASNKYGQAMAKRNMLSFKAPLIHNRQGMKNKTFA